MRIFTTLLFISFLSTTASATSFTVTGSTDIALPNAEIFNGAGDFDFSFSLDDTTQILNGSINFTANSNGSLADFFFFTLTSGSAPAASASAATIVFDASNGGLDISAYGSTPFDGATQPIIDAFAGDLLFTTVNTGSSSNVISAENSSDGSTFSSFNFEIDYSNLPPLSFSSAAGIWLQTAGLDRAFGTFVDYDSTGRISLIEADIGSAGGYGFFDIANAPTTASAVLPEPSSLLLLGGALGLFGRRRKKQ